MDDGQQQQMKTTTTTTTTTTNTTMKQFALQIERENDDGHPLKTKKLSLSITCIEKCLLDLDPVNCFD